MATTANPTTSTVNEHSAAAETAAADAGAKKKTRIRVIAMSVLGVGVLGVVGWYVAHAGLEDTDDAEVDANVVAVPAQLSAVVTKVDIHENQQVKAGDVLVELDPGPAKAKLDEASAQLQSDQAAADAADQQVDVIQASATGQRSAAEASLRGSSITAGASADEIAQADAQVKSAKVSRDQAQTDLDRVKSLYQQGAVPKQTLDDAQMRLETTDATLTQATAHQSSMRASQAEAQTRVAVANARLQQSGSVSAQIAQARAQAAQAHARVALSQAARDLAQLDFDHTKIVAPADGLASKKSVVVGQMVSVGQPVVQIVPLKDVWVTANFKETQLSSMRAGQTAEIDVDAYSGMKLHGQLESFSGATGARFSLLPPENATGNFTKVVQRVPVRIKLDDVPQDRPLRPGMSVEVTVDTRH